MNQDNFEKFVNMGQLVSVVANLEAGTLDVRDVLKKMGNNAPGESVGDELQQIAAIADRIASKLAITDQVKSYRAMQEARVEASRNMNESFRNAMKVFREMLPAEEWEI